MPLLSRKPGCLPKTKSIGRRYCGFRL
jgi:hypothetical protein